MELCERPSAGVICLNFRFLSNVVGEASEGKLEIMEHKNNSGKKISDLREEKIELINDNCTNTTLLKI